MLVGPVVQVDPKCTVAEVPRLPIVIGEIERQPIVRDRAFLDGSETCHHLTILHQRTLVSTPGGVTR